MTRQLRPRKKATNYAALAAIGVDEEGSNQAGPSKPSKKVQENESEASGSDFYPGQDFNLQELADVELDEDGGIEEEEEDISPPRSAKRRKTIPAPAAASANQSQSSKVKGKSKAVEEQGTPGIKPPRRQMYVLPVPSVNHRHRAVQIYVHKGRAERVIGRPTLFSAPSVALTNAFSTNSKVRSRVNKSWGYNIGPGPLWDLCEDRGWYKEAISTSSDPDRETQRRPIVYSDLPLPVGWRLLTPFEAIQYLPTDDATTEDGNLRPPPSIPCLLGPIKAQTKHNVEMFEAFPLSEYTAESTSHVFNAGAPVWGLDWCPTHPEMRSSRSYKQYLAVGPFPSQGHSPDIGTRVVRPSLACIQIWSLSPLTEPPGEDDNGRVRCEMVLGINSGPAYDLKWCPLPSHSTLSDSDVSQPKKLGLLGGTFEDGSFSLFVVPNPSGLASPTSTSEPVYVEIPNPVLRIEFLETTCWTFDWANSETIAIGTTNGVIAVYDLGPALKAYRDPNMPPIVDLLPTHYLSVHQSAIRALTWIKAPPSLPSGEPKEDADPTVIASGGYDGMECLTDIRESRGSIINRTRDVINTMCFSTFAGGPITLDHENTVKAYSASPSMLGRGHSLMEPQGPIWSIHTSDYHPHIAVCAADGTCSTTNTLRATRRGGSVPFFVYKIFQMDYNRNTRTYRMVDRFYPQEFVDRTTATRAAKGKAKADDTKSGSTGAWPREVGVHRVVWNNGNGLASSSLLAAGTASGLCRIDCLWGRWAKDKIPYGSVENIRLEDQNEMDVDSDSEVESD